MYAEALALAALAEQVGLDSVWVSEHHFVDDAYLPSLLPMCAAIAAPDPARRGRYRPAPAPYEPLRLAEDAAVADLISGGQLVLGLGLGWREEEFEELRVPVEERVSRLEDSVLVLRQAWAGGLVTGGARFRYRSVPVTPAPARPGGPPIWIGAMGEPAIRRAGRIGDGFMATEVASATLAKQVRWAREERVRDRPGSRRASR